ncbi:tripartite tricarboxylate transporter TctB family protein [Tropicimonas sp.]|uniref:tripartite tricarboxylate transporter TctB family protein n=1 Tax=Tropicimonas sp. TaxID=2067044 RepID=UPI003A8A86D7
MKTRAGMGDSAIGLPVFLLIFTTIYLAEAFRIHPQVSGDSFVGPRFVPVLTAIGMYVTLLIVLVREFRDRRIRSAEAVAGQEGGTDFLRPALIVLATAIYIALFRPLGYVISTAGYVAVLFLIFQYETGRPLRFALGVAGVVLVFYGLFGVVFGVRLPPLPGMN